MQLELEEETEDAGVTEQGGVKSGGTGTRSIFGVWISDPEDGLSSHSHACPCVNSSTCHLGEFGFFLVSLFAYHFEEGEIMR